MVGIACCRASYQHAELSACTWASVAGSVALLLVTPDLLHCCRPCHRTCTAVQAAKDAAEGAAVAPCCQPGI